MYLLLEPPCPLVKLHAAYLQIPGQVRILPSFFFKKKKKIIPCLREPVSHRVIRFFSMFLFSLFHCPFGNNASVISLHANLDASPCPSNFFLSILVFKIQNVYYPPSFLCWSILARTPQSRRHTRPLAPPSRHRSLARCRPAPSSTLRPPAPKDVLGWPLDRFPCLSSGSGLTRICAS